MGRLQIVGFKKARMEQPNDCRLSIDAKFLAPSPQIAHEFDCPTSIDFTVSNFGGEGWGEGPSRKTRTLKTMMYGLCHEQVNRRLIELIAQRFSKTKRSSRFLSCWSRTQSFCPRHLCHDVALVVDFDNFD